MSKVAIYGAGLRGKVLLEVIENRGIKVDFFIDQFIKIKELGGKPIYRLDDREVSFDTTIYMTVAENIAPNRGILSISENLKKLGFAKIFDFVQTLYEFPEFLKYFSRHKEALWLCEDKDKMVNKAKIDEFKHLLSDQKSIDLLKHLTEFREKLTPETYVLPDQATQYFPEDIDMSSKIDKLRFIDCGAYRGDTISSLLKHWEKPIECIAAFEPDQLNFEALKHNLTNNKSPDLCLLICPCGIWSHDDILHFKTGQGPSSSVTHEKALNEKTVSVPVLSLDESVFTLQPNYIKMDIEGSEKAALMGAKKIISTYTPILAVSLYHKPEDLWEIPLYIHKINNKYDMYVRLHGHLGLETVLYCIPKEGCAENNSGGASLDAGGVQEFKLETVLPNMTRLKGCTFQVIQRGRL